VELRERRNRSGRARSACGAARARVRRPVVTDASTEHDADPHARRRDGSLPNHSRPSPTRISARGKMQHAYSSSGTRVAVLATKRIQSPARNPFIHSHADDRGRRRCHSHVIGTVSQRRDAERLRRSASRQLQRFALGAARGRDAPAVSREDAKTSQASNCG
jgi:hypothetical protein